MLQKMKVNSLHGGTTSSTIIERYESGQLWLLLNGQFAYVYDVDGRSKMNSSEDTRSVYIMTGSPATKSNVMAVDGTRVEYPPYNMSVVITIKPPKKQVMKDFGKLVAVYIGKVSPEKAQEIQRELNMMRNN